MSLKAEGGFCISQLLKAVHCLFPGGREGGWEDKREEGKAGWTMRTDGGVTH